MTGEQDSRLWIDYVPLESIEPATRNAKRHDVEGLIELIATHGYMHVGIRDERTGRSVAGHGRREALVAMYERGMERPAKVLLAEDGRGWLVPVQCGWSSEDDAQAEEVILALNRAQDWAGTDAATEWLMLDDLQAHDPGALDRLHYDDVDMDRLFAAVNPDLADITGDPDGPDRADPGPALGQDEDSPLDDDEPEPSFRPTTECPSCGWRWEQRL